MGNVQAGTDFLISSFYGVTELYHLRTELKCRHAGCIHNATVRKSVSSPTVEFYTEVVTRFPSEVQGSILFVILCVSGTSQSQA